MSIIEQHVSLKKWQFASAHGLMRPRVAAAAPIAPHGPSAPSAAGAWRGRFGDLRRRVGRAAREQVDAWLARRTVESLHALDDRMLRDIGLQRCDIEFVVHRHMLRGRQGPAS